MQKSKIHAPMLQLGVKTLVDTVRVAQGKNWQFPTAESVHRAMTREELRVEVAAFMQNGEKAGTQLNGLLSLICNNGIDVEIYEDIGTVLRKQKPQCLVRIDPDGMSVFIPESEDYIVAFQGKAPYFRKMFTCAHEAAHIYLEHHRERCKLPSAVQEAEANFFAYCLNSRQAIGMIAEALKTHEPVNLGLKGFYSLICALMALTDEKGGYLLSSNTLLMVSAAIESIQPQEGKSNE